MHEPVVWLKADHFQYGNACYWPNNSSNIEDAKLNTSSGSTFRKGAVNYNDMVVLEGDSPAISIPVNPEKHSSFTFMAVFHTEGESEQMVWANEGGRTRDMFLSTSKVAGPDGIQYLTAENKTAPLLVSVIHLWGDPADNPGENGHILLGAPGSNRTGIDHLKGGIAEFMVFDFPVEKWEKTQFESYLAIKYGITLQGDYISSQGKQLWDGYKDVDFKNRITGIGRDDAFELNQKQSSTTVEDPLLTISVGELAESNSANKSILDNQQFLLFGDNGKALEPEESGSGPLRMYERRWLMRAAGDGAKFLKTGLHLNCNRLSQSGEFSQVLVIDRSGTGNFPEGQVEYVEGTISGLDSMIVFKDVQWDADGSGTDVFGFASIEAITLIATAKKQPNCNNEFGGELDLQVLGGSPPIQYTLINKLGMQEFRWQDELRSGKSELGGGNYTVEIVDALGESAQAMTVLSQPKNLTLDLGEDRMISKGKEFSIDISNQVPISELTDIHWESSNGFHSTSHKVLLEEAGSYSFSATTAEGCKLKDWITLSTDAILKFEVNPSIVLDGQAPQIKIHLDGPGEVKLQITNVSGKVLHKWSSDGESVYVFDRPLQANGTYFVELITGNQQEIRKVVVTE